MIDSIDKIDITLMDAAGNRFVVVDEFDQTVIQESFKENFVREISEDCSFDPDSVLFISKSHKADIMMRIFDRDGTEETMCGNGLRCTAKIAYQRGYINKYAYIETRDGIKPACILKSGIQVSLGKVREYRFINSKVHFAFSGIPHIVVFVNDLDNINAEAVARNYRYDSELTTSLGYPDNMHVNLIQLINKNHIRIKTYEACVERITEACGTGAVASAYVAHRGRKCSLPVKVECQGGVLQVDCIEDNFFLKGPADIIDEIEYLLPALELVY